jgi:hypothetical protein
MISDDTLLLHRFFYSWATFAPFQLVTCMLSSKRQQEYIMLSFRLCYSEIRKNVPSRICVSIHVSRIDLATICTVRLLNYLTLTCLKVLAWNAANNYFIFLLILDVQISLSYIPNILKWKISKKIELPVLNVRLKSTVGNSRK